MSSTIPVVVVTGPTASGKTQLAIELAKHFSGEIVNADSMQVYRYLDIGTAKPTLEQRSEVTHHLLDFVSPEDSYNAGRFARAAEEAAAELRTREKVVFLTGGTGLYIRAFLEGLVESPGRDADYRAELEAEHQKACEAGDPELLHRRLRQLDPPAAERIHPHDLHRTIRALELHYTTGSPASELRERQVLREDRYRVLYLVVDCGRELLGERIHERCRGMIDGGLLREVRDLRDRGFGPDLPCMKAIGYRHMQPVLDGSDTLANVCNAMVRDTKQYARRQRTWFRRVPNAVWVSPDDRGEITAHIEAFLAAA